MWASYSAQRERRLDSRISQQSHCLFGCRLVRRDRRDTLERRQGPKSLCVQIAPRSWFLIRAHPWTSGSIPLHRRYLGYGWLFSRTDSRFQTRLLFKVLDLEQGQNHSYAPVGEEKFEFLWKGYDTWFNFITTGDSERVSISNSADCLFSCCTGPIRERSSCFPEPINLNQDSGRAAA